MIVAIDGPAGSGKSSTAKLISQSLNWKYLDTGAMYRAVTHYFLTHQISTDSINEIQNALKMINIVFRSNGKQQVWMNGENVSSCIRESNVTKNVSFISSLPIVRKFLIKTQRQFAELGNVVMEGRDIGTEVFPNADIKIFLTASIESRATRRLNELKDSGKEILLDELIKDIKLRDKKDRERKASPLRIAKDAVLIDTTGMSLEEQTTKIIKLIEQKSQ
tara:strand:+ start:248 stop:907 length:660 start_codon:yes stop_codon:yes gene_type:complete